MYTYLSMESGKRKDYQQRKENIKYEYKDENDVCSMATKWLSIAIINLLSIARRDGGNQTHNMVTLDEMEQLQN